MVLLGCRPAGRNTEQHDVFFGIAEDLQDLKPHIATFWKEQKLHVDAWREVVFVDGFRIEVVPKKDSKNDGPRLFFINLGGYKPEAFEEFHYKLLAVAEDKGGAIAKARKTAFYLHTGFPGASSHIDDKFGVDVDDIEDIEEILPEAFTKLYSLNLIPAPETEQDAIHLGYLKWEKIGSQGTGS